MLRRDNLRKLIVGVIFLGVLGTQVLYSGGLKVSSNPQTPTFTTVTATTGTFTGVSVSTMVITSSTTIRGPVTMNQSAIAGGLVTIRGTANSTGFVFDPTVITGQGGLGIGTAPSNKLDISINAGAAYNCQFQNSSTSGYATWRAKANGSTEYVDFGVGGSAVASPFTDVAYIYAESGLSNGLKIFTNGSNVAITVGTNQETTFAAAITLYSRTAAQLQTSTPTALGQLVFNSGVSRLFISTGTSAAGQWADSSNYSTGP